MIRPSSPPPAENPLPVAILVNGSRRWCGVDEVCLSEAEALAERAECFFFAAKGSDFAKRLSERGLPFQVLPAFLPFALVAVAKRLRALRATWLHLHTAKHYPLAVLRLVFPRLRLFLTRHNSLPLAKVNAPLLDLANVVICVSEDNASSLRRRFPRIASRLRTVPLSLSPGRKIRVFPFPDASQGLHFVYAGRITEAKGAFDLLRAMENLLDLPVHLHLAGEPENEAGRTRLSSALASHALQGRVTWHGFVANVESLFARCHLVVQPTRIALREAFGLAALEAQVCGRAVLVTPSGGLPEVVAHEVTGRVLATDGSEALATALRDLATDPARLAAWGRAGAERAAREFGFDAFRTRLHSVFQIPSTP